MAHEKAAPGADAGLLLLIAAEKPFERGGDLAPGPEGYRLALISFSMMVQSILLFSLN